MPPRSSRTSTTDSRAASAAASVASACGRSVSPASVGVSPRPARANRATPELGLEAANLLGQRRLRHVELLRGAAERAVAVRGEEVLELLQGQGRTLGSR